jgi:hypothetical protein
MAATDYELLLYRRLKAILLAHAPLTALVKPLSFIWYDAARTDPEQPNTVGGPAIRPFVALEPAGYTQEHWEARPRYGDHNVNADPAALNRKVVLVFNFTVRITHNDLRLAMDSPVEAEVMRALRGSNPTLSIPGSPMTAGYSWVRGWGPLTVQRTIGYIDGDTGQRRMQSVFTIPVATVFNSADLLT